MLIKQILMKLGSTLLSLNKSARLEPKINNKNEFCDANYAMDIISMINNMSEKYNEVKQVLETYYNNFT